MGFYDQKYEKKRRQRNLMLVMVFLGLLAGGLLLKIWDGRRIEVVPADSQAEQAKKGAKSSREDLSEASEMESEASVQESESIDHLKPDREAILLPESTVVESEATASGEDEGDPSKMSVEEEALLQKREVMKGKLEDFIHYQLGSLAKDFNSFAFSCKPPDYQLEMPAYQRNEGSSRPRNRYLYPDWNSRSWIDFFSAVYDYYRDNRSLFNSRSYNFRTGQTNQVGLACRSRLTGFASILKNKLASFSTLEEEGRKLGLYPGDIRDIMDELDFDIHDLEELLSILEDCAAEFK